MKSEFAAAGRLRESIQNTYAAASSAPADRAVASLTPAEYALFAEIGRRRRCDAGEVLFRRGDLGTTMYVVASGAVELDFGEDLTGKRLGPNEFFGELGLLIGDHARSADARVPVDSVLVELDEDEFDRLVERDPALVSYFLRRAIMRVVLNEQGLIRRLRRRNQDLQTALDTLRATAHQLNQTEALIRTDELTGLHNRRGLAQHLLDRRRNGTLDGLGLVLIDCDRFKAVNDEYGHLVGDRVLQSVANIMRSVVGVGELACRLGGDEFCLLIKANSGAEVLRFAEFIVSTAQSLIQMPRPSQGAQAPLMCTLSLGACLINGDGDWNDWYAQADAALYRAKRLGGNRIEWQEAVPSPA